MKKFKIFSPKEAAIECVRQLKMSGFVELRSIRKNDSGYLIKSGYRGRKIRVSNHPMKGNFHVDVAVDIVYNDPTIINDINITVKKAIEKYDKWKRTNI